MTDRDHDETLRALIAQARNNSKERDRGSTHWEDCWRVHTRCLSWRLAEALEAALRVPVDRPPDPDPNALVDLSLKCMTCGCAAYQPNKRCTAHISLWDRYQTEVEMHKAWEKRAYEAEAELLRRDAVDRPRGHEQEPVWTPEKLARAQQRTEEIKKVWREEPGGHEQEQADPTRVDEPPMPHPVTPPKNWSPPHQWKTCPCPVCVIRRMFQER